MYKNTSRNYGIKVLLTVFIFTLSITLLSSCSKKDKPTPYGDLTDNKYVSSEDGKYYLTEKQLYDIMKIRKGENGFYATNIILDLLEKEIFKTKISEYQLNNDEYKEFLLENIYGSSDEEVINKLTSKKIKDYLSTFENYLLTLGVVYDIEDKENLLNIDALISDSKLQPLKDNYILQQVQKSYVNDLLLKEVDDEDSDNYISQEDIETYYNDSYEFENQDKVGVLYNKFNSYKEAMEFFTSENINSTTTEFEFLKAQINIYNSLKPLNKDKITGYETATDVAGLISVLSNEDNKDKVFIESSSLPSSISTYVLNTLSAVDKEDGSKFIKYTKEPLSFSGVYYSIYKIKDVETKKTYDELTDSEKETINAEIKEKLIEKKLTNEYISQKLNNQISEYDVTIYDSLIEIIYQSVYSYKTSKKTSKEYVATFKSKESTYDIKVNDFFDSLVLNYGIPTSYEYLAGNKILELYKDKLDEEIIKEKQEELDTIIKNYKNDQYATVGLPKSISEKNFLKLYFGVETKDEALYFALLLDKASELFLYDPSFKNSNNQDFYNIFLNLSNRLYDNFFDLTTNHLLVFIDTNNDNSPENPEEFYKELNDATREEEIRTLINNLHKEIYEFITKEGIISDFEESINYFINEIYNKSTRFTGDYKDYHLANIKIKYESLGSLTNSNLTNYDNKFANRVYQLAQQFKTNDTTITAKDKFIDTETDSVTETKSPVVVESSFGYHVLFIEKNTKPVSAKYTGTSHNNVTINDGYNPEYTGLTAKNENDKLTKDQIIIYLNEYSKPTGVENLPTSVTTYIESFLTPILNKYNNDSNSYLLYNRILDLNFTDSNIQNVFKKNNISTYNNFINNSMFEGHDLPNPYEDWNTLFDIKGVTE